jgi:hypothetical protein
MQPGTGLLLLVASGLLAACGNTGRVMSGAVAGVSAAGSMAVGAVGAVGGAAVSAASFVVGAGAQAVGAAGSAATGGIASAVGASGTAAEGGTQTEPTVTRASAASGSAAEAAAGASGGGAMQVEAVAAAGALGASLAGLEILDQAGREGTYRAGELLSTQRQPADRCALQVFLGVAGEFGFAQGARFAVWLGERVRAEGARTTFSGMLMLADSMTRDISDAAREAQGMAADLLGFEDEATLRQTISVANDIRNRCPAGAAGQLAKMLETEAEESPSI